jgi:hypothetical protein
MLAWMAWHGLACLLTVRARQDHHTLATILPRSLHLSEDLAAYLPRALVLALQGPIDLVDKYHRRRVPSSHLE